MDTATSYIARVTQLPPAPTLLNELLVLFRDPDRDVDRVVELLSHDPALTAEVLKRSNGVFFGGGAASDMFEAVSRIGFYEVYCMVVAMFGAKTKSMPGVAEGLDPSKLWKHTVVTAVAASTLASRCGQPEGSAFTAGLLHDIGKLVFASAEGKGYGALLEQVGRTGESLIDAEQQAFGTNHAKIGGCLLQQWKFPCEIHTAVWHHHNPAAAGADSAMPVIIHLADWIAHGYDSGEPLPLTASASQAFASIRLGPADLPALNNSIMKALDRVKSLLEL